MYHNHFNHLHDIPTTRHDLNPIDYGQHPYKASAKLNKRDNQINALKAYLRSHYTYDKNFYNPTFINYIELNALNYDDILVKRFVDFEAWYRKYAL